MPLPPQIKVTTGKFELLSSGVTVFDPKDGLSIAVGVLTIKMIFVDGDVGSPSEKPATTVTSEPETLTRKYEFSGRLPTSPMAFFSTTQQEIGIAGGNKIFLAWKLSKLNSANPLTQLTYTIYREIPEIAKDDTKGDING